MRDNKRNQFSLSIDFHSFIRGIVKAIEAKDYYTAGHSDRVADLAEEITEVLGLPEDESEIIHIAAHLHDIGKIGIPDSILMKPGALTKKEYEIMKQHSIFGWEILREIDGFDEIAQLVRWHHERPDGNGYPDGLAYNSIPRGALIIAIADSYDAMTSKRSYNKSMSPREAVTEIFRQQNKQFAPFVVKAFLELMKTKYENIDLDEIIVIQNKTADNLSLNIENLIY